jgi:hypothetical protein
LSDNGSYIAKELASYKQHVGVGNNFKILWGKLGFPEIPTGRSIRDAKVKQFGNKNN